MISMSLRDLCCRSPKTWQGVSQPGYRRSMPHSSTDPFKQRRLQFLSVFFCNFYVYFIRIHTYTIWFCLRIKCYGLCHCGWVERVSSRNSQDGALLTSLIANLFSTPRLGKPATSLRFVGHIHVRLKGKSENRWLWGGHAQPPFACTEAAECTGLNWICFSATWCLRIEKQKRSSEQLNKVWTRDCYSMLQVLLHPIETNLVSVEPPKLPG